MKKSQLLAPVLAFVVLAAGPVTALAAAAPKSKEKEKSAKSASPAAPAAPGSSPARKKPEITLDPTPISTSPAGRLVSYADVVEPVQQAVVSVYSTKIIKERLQVNPLLRQFFPNLPDQERESKQEGMGSGVIVTADGYILTNNHVIEGADELKVSLADDREFTAKLIGTDPKTDVAVIKIEAEKLPVVTLADSEKLRVGDIVFAVGNPLGVGQTVTMGIVSAKGRNKVGILEGGYEDFIQTDAAINMGNSGGALVDAKGRLVGINSAILSPSRGNIGIGFAIPVNLAASVMNSLVLTGSVARGSLGVRTPPDADAMTPDVAEQLGLPRDTKGVLITDIDADSPAEKAGIKRSDVILGVDGHTVTSLQDLRLRISQMVPGTVTRLRIMRDGKERFIDVTLGSLDANPNELFPGVNVTPLTNETRRRLGLNDPRVTGLVITDLTEDSPLRDRLAPDVVIIEINKKPVVDLPTARTLVKQGGDNLLAVWYRGQIRFAVITLPKGR